MIAFNSRPPGNGTGLVDKLLEHLHKMYLMTQIDLQKIFLPAKLFLVNAELKYENDNSNTSSHHLLTFIITYSYSLYIQEIIFQHSLI